MNMRPRLTVAAMIEHDGRFLMVEEQRGESMVLNQPAGHVENGESLLDAVVRETLEETGRRFTPEALLGIYHWTNPQNGLTFLRFAITGAASEPDPGQTLDEEIIDTIWLDRNEIFAQQHRLRSPMVLRCVEDYLTGRRHPLDLVTHIL